VGVETLPLNQVSVLISTEDERWMRYALNLAKKARDLNEVPVGAVIVREDQIIGEGFNSSICNHDASAHAEIQAIRHAGEVTGNYRLTGSTLYVTIEPCVMCVGAIVHARMNRLVFGASEPKAGAIKSAHQLLDHSAMNYKVEACSGVLEVECQNLILNFFRQRRLEKKNDKIGN